jgi:hypothetical protein
LIGRLNQTTAIDKTNMENDYAFAYLEDKYTFILQIIKVKDMCAMYTIGI